MRRVNVIGKERCKGFIGLHHFSGADWGGKFVGITKKRWVDAYMKLPIDDQAIKCFQELGNHQHLSEMVGEDLPAEDGGWKNFCVSYILHVA